MTWFAAPIMVVAVASCSQETSMNAETLRVQLAAALPAGSTAQQVADYVNTQNLSSDGPVSVDQLVPVKESPGDTDLLSMVRNVRTSGLVSTGVQMRFVFGPNKRLKTIIVRDAHTGL
jgi:hypothetical protein